jgi:hypothetical protein
VWVELGIVAGIGAMTFVAWPLWSSRNRRSSKAMSLRLGELETQRDLAFRELVDLDDDRSLGKISDEDYAPLLAESRQRAAVLLKEIDLVRPLAETEMALANAEVESVEGEEALQGSRVCPNCDSSTEPSANFCSNCGVRLREDSQPNPDRPVGTDETP